jgi:DNA-binding winged helix-turn-helix (wHTH) protein/Tfp pilus assembly protein PilF
MAGNLLKTNRLLTFGPYRLNVLSRVLMRDEQLVPLPSKAIDVLLVLVKRCGEVVSKNDLMEAVWPDAFVEEGNLTQSIHLLRRALQDKTEEHRYILTIPGRGYSFVAVVQEVKEEQTTTGPHPKATQLLDHQNADLNATDVMIQGPRRLIGLGKRKVLLAVIFALPTFVAIAEMLPPLARHFNNKGTEFQSRGELQAAIGEYRGALLLRPSYAEARYNLANAYEEIPDYEKAIEEYQKAIDSDVTFYAAYNNLARLYILRRRDPGAALRLIDRALSLNPQETSVQYSLLKNAGWANFELRNDIRAEQDLKHATQLQSNRGAAHCLLAKVLDAEAREAEAYPEWEECLSYSSQSDVEPEWRNEAQEHIQQKESK